MGQPRIVPPLKTYNKYTLWTITPNPPPKLYITTYVHKYNFYSLHLVLDPKKMQVSNKICL